MSTRPEPQTLDPAAAPPAGSLVLSLVGSGGDGIALLGDLVLAMAAQQGLYGMMVQSYGPQIRGGESAAILRIAREEVHWEGEETDVLLCFRARDLARFAGAVKLHRASLVVLEASDDAPLPEWLGRSARPEFRYPFATFVDGVEAEGEPKNMMALALLCRVLGWPASLAHRMLERRFGRRPAVAQRNRAAFDRAWAAGEAVPALPHLAGHGVPLYIESGNEAIARGAIEAGVRFFAGYPITPASEIMETLIDELPAVGGRVVQAEDEIAAIGMVLGASFGGVPAMTATSGPGLSLKTEMMGLASMAEIPAIIVDCQRAGPATGMPSRTEQADLNHALYAGHGDFPRVVLGVFDAVHARDVMHRAVRLSEGYQLPVLVLSDAYIAQRRTVRDHPSDNRGQPKRVAWKPGDPPARFHLTGDQVVSPFRIPGTPGGQYLSAGIEHTLEGYPSASGEVHQMMNEKRFRKLPAIARETRDWVRTLGRDDAPFGLVAWGSLSGLLREWVRERPEWRVFLPEIIHPFPVEAFTAWREGLQWLGVVELSFGAQLHRYMSTVTDMRGVASLGRSGGMSITASELDRMLAAARKEAGR
uniref:2-oxoacid:acceptor oxidoreductase subunit alpha n=1 Tax=Eiseniibacteriota bacterium TaxID=2212470 RepID=A0A832I4N4_UNCEI